DRAGPKVELAVSAGVWCAVALLGGAGAVLRFAVDWLVSLRLGFRFPLWVLPGNLSGAFLLALREPRVQSQRRLPARAAGRTLSARSRLPTGRHRRPRLLHDVLGLDARH